MLTSARNCAYPHNTYARVRSPAFGVRFYGIVFLISTVRTLCVGAISVWRHHTSYVDVPTQVTAMMCQ